MTNADFNLSQSHPWTQDEKVGFLWSILLSAVGFTLIYWAAQPSNAGTLCDPQSIPACSRRLPDPGYIRPGMMFPLITVLLLVANAPSPIKRLHGLVQYLLCVAVVLGLLLYSHRRSYDTEYRRPFDYVLGSFACGTLGFGAFRVNWWFYWDYPSRRTVMERSLGSIFYTTLVPLGAVVGLFRLLGIGVRPTTTDFVVDPSVPDGVLEVIPEHPALAAHAQRMEVIQAARSGTGAGRMAAPDKESASGSI